MTDATLRKGSFALCGRGALGLVTSDGPVEVNYRDGTKATAWTGVHLTDKFATVGSPWASRNPKPVGHISEVGNSSPALYSSTMLYLVGRWYRTDQVGVTWDIIGIFSSKSIAEIACPDEYCFVAPIVLDRAVINDPEAWPGAYYPKAAPVPL